MNRRLTIVFLASFVLSAPVLAAQPSQRGRASGAAGVPVPEAPGHLQGTVLSADGKPITRFTVNTIAFQDPKGSFHVLVPPQGEFRMVIRAEGHAPTVIRVNGASGKKLVVPEIVLGQGEDLIGEVLDAETRRPIVAARLAIADPPKPAALRFLRPERLSEAATTGSGGMFRIARAPRGLAMLVVSHPDYLPEFVPLNTRQARPTILLHRGGAINGTVRGPLGEPLAGARVTAVSESAEDAQEVRTDSSGRFDLRSLRPGRYTVLAKAPGAAPVTQSVEVPEGRAVKLALLLRGKMKRLEVPEIQLDAVTDPDPRGLLALR